jgi:hypothetical protein
MTVRRWVPLIACLLATFTVAIAQPKKAPAKKAPAAGSGSGSAKAPTPTPGSGSGSADAPPPDEGPPADMEGKDENPGAPHALPGEEPKVVEKAPEKKVITGYPMEEVLRPITLPANMAEVAIGPHAQFSIKDDVGYAGSDTLRARYGITRQIQLGLNYTFAGIYDDPKTAEDKVKFKPGKAIELNGTYLIKDYLGIRLGVPVWIYKPGENADSSAPGIGVNIGVPLKFRFGEKFAIGGLDDLLSIKITQFAPSMEYEYLNAIRAALKDTKTATSAGFIRFSGYGVYQRSPKLALIGRVAITLEDFATTKTTAGPAPLGGGIVTTIRAGLEYTVRKYLDVGIAIGFEDMADLGSFGPTALLAFRI